MQNKALSKIWILIILIIIIVGGYFGWRHLNKSEQETETSGQFTEDKTANWNNYQNTIYDYEIKYPPELETSKALIDSWRVSAEALPMIMLDFPSASEDVEIGHEDPEKGPEFIQIMIEVQDARGKSLDSLVEQNCILENQEGEFIKINCLDREARIWMISSVFVKNNLFYMVSIVMLSMEPISDLSFPQEELNIYNQMLSTFRFIEGGETAEERACINSGGIIKGAGCCLAVGDFPNLCLIGACGCSAENIHMVKAVKACDCGAGKCFDGETCVSR